MIIRKILEATGWTQHKLAAELNVQQPTISRWLKGSEPKFRQRNKIFELAKKHGLVDGSGSLERDFTVQVVGTIGRNGEINFDIAAGKNGNEFGGAPMPPKPISPTMVAVVMRGDGMAGQIEDGWTVYYDPGRLRRPEELLGKLCVVKVASGPALIRRLLPGRSAGLYALIANNAAPLYDQALDWVTPIAWILPT